MTEKVLITHVLPHLDDVAAFWLYRKFVPGFDKARIEFVPKTNPETLIDKVKADTDPNYVYVGVGEGKYDEHKGDLNDCSTSLVFKELVAEELIGVGNEVELLAVEHLVNYVTLVDLGKLRGSKHEEFAMGAICHAAYPEVDDKFEKSKKIAKLAFTMLDAVYEECIEIAKVKRDWKKGYEFDSKWGKGFAIETSASGVDSYGYQQGYALMVFINPKNGSRQIKATTTSGADLTHAHEWLKKHDKEADWYLHHSTRLLLCKRTYDESIRLSHLSLEKLVDLVKK